MSKDIYPVVAPPRTSSTMIGASISMNSRIDGYCHEPFLRLRYDSIRSYDSCKEILDSGDSVVVKGMTQWLDIDDEYKRFFCFVERPIVFITRDPVLCAESKIRKLVQTFNMREKDAVTEQLNRLGFENINEFARYHGHSDSNDMVLYCISSKNYQAFGDLLHNDGIFSLREMGWESLRNQVEYSESNNLPFHILDSTYHRKNPVESTMDICNLWELDFEPQMVRWGRGNIEINTGQAKDYQKIWYQRLMDSEGIEPPTETRTSLSHFPEFIADYLVETCIPIHEEMHERIRYRMDSHGILKDGEYYNIPDESICRHAVGMQM